MTLRLLVERDEPLASVIERLPEAATLDAGATVTAVVSSPRGLLARVFGSRQPVDRTVRATALLARGYRAIEARRDEVTGDDLVVGLA